MLKWGRRPDPPDRWPRCADSRRQDLRRASAMSHPHRRSRNIRRRPRRV